MKTADSFRALSLIAMIEHKDIRMRTPEKSSCVCLELNEKRLICTMDINIFFQRIYIKDLHSLNHLLLECGDVEENPGPKNKYKNKAFIRKQFSTFNKREILDGFKECFRNEDDLSSVSKTGVWGRLLEYIGKPPTRVAILVFKRWCMKNNILEECFLDNKRQNEEIDDNSEPVSPNQCRKNKDNSKQKKVLEIENESNDSQTLMDMHRFVQKSKSGSLNKEMLKFPNEKEIVNREQSYKDHSDTEHDKEKQISYNLRPGRCVRNNKRYFNDLYDCSTKRKKVKTIMSYSQISTQPSCSTVHSQHNTAVHYHSMKDLRKNDNEWLEVSDHEEQAASSSTFENANGTNLMNFLQSVEDTTNSEDIDNVSTKGSPISVELPNIERKDGKCSTFADIDDVQLTNKLQIKINTHDSDSLDRIPNAESKENSFSEETLETTVGVSLLDPFFKRTVPSSGHFYISEEQWKELKASQNGRCFSSCNWENIICDGIKDANPFCVYMFKWHKVSVANERRSSAKPVFRGEGICKFPDCQNVLKFAMDKERKVLYTMSEHVKHAIEQSFSRPFRGEKRQELKAKFQDGPKPFKCYLDKFNSVGTEVKLAGNFSEFGNSPQTFQKIASESRFTHTLEKSEFESLLRVSEQMTADSNAKRLPGFIRHISIFPPIIMYWSETGVRIWHDMAKDSIVFWDATGSVISPRKDRPRFYYYELACLNPTKDQNIIPVTSLLSTLHSTPMIRFWISEFRRAEKTIFGHGNIAIPKQVNSDRSLVFIQAALSEFNSETMDDFKSRAWRIINGEASCCDMSKVNPHACLSHVMSSFKKIIKDVFKSNSEFGMFCFSLILNSRYLNDMKENISSVYRVLLSKSLDPETEVVLKIINKKLSKLRSSDDKELENSEILIDTDSIFPEFAQASRLTEEDYLNRSTTNAFYNMSEEILQKVKKEISSTACHGAEENRFYSSTLVEKIHKLYMPTLPLWSNLLIGDLSRHGSSPVYQSYVNSTKQIRGNTSIEKRFQVLKNITFGGKPVYRLDEFSVQLQTHVETLQNMAIIKSIKSGRNERKGKSTKTIEEEWDKKKTTLPNKRFGKYQVPPTKEFSASGSEKKVRKGKISTNLSDKALIDDSDKYADAVTLLQSPESVQGYSSFLYSHNCDLILTKILRREGCIGQRHLIFPKCLEATVKENKYMMEHTYGLANVGNSCWFNAVLMALFSTDIVQLALDRYNKDMTFCPYLQKSLCIINNLHNELEVSTTDICNALDDLQEAFQIDARRQNDAHEFLTTWLSELTRSLDYRNMRIREIITCLTCGKVTIREEDATSLSLGVPAGMDNVCMKDLLDDFFKDENIEGARCDMCHGHEKYKKCVPVFFPNTMILSLQRYKVNKWDNIEKDRTNIYPDNFVNFKNYTTREDELIYKLEGVVMHKGPQPTSGHYTALRKASDSFILIDDEHVQKYQDNTLNKDGYLLIYCSLKISDSFFIYLTCCCISNSAVHASLEFYMLNAAFMSPVKRQILDRLANFRINTDASVVPGDNKLLYLIHHSQVKVRCNVEYIYDVVNYLVDQYPYAPQHILGVDVLQHFSCDNCNRIFGKTKHVIILKEDDIESYRKDRFMVETDCTCGIKITGKQVISKIGKTVLVQSSPGMTSGFPNMRVVLPKVANVIFPDVLLEFNVSVCLIPQEQCVIFFSDNNCVLLDNCEEMTTISQDQFLELASKKRHVLFCDKTTDENKVKHLCTKQPGEDFPKMFGYEIVETILPEFDSDTEKMLNSFSCSISINNYNLDGSKVESFLHGWLTDLHIDLFLSALASDTNNRNCVALPCNWFSKMSHDYVPNQTYHEWNKKYVLIPINVQNRHWILIVLSLKDRCIVCLDPQGGFYDEFMAKMLHFLRIQLFLHTGKKMDFDEWIVKEAALSESFPKQNDCESCGVYVCLYATLILKRAALDKKIYGQDYTIRQLILLELLQRTFFQQKQPFGLKELLLYKNLDETVLSIASADENSVGESLERHKTFLNNPSYYYCQYLVNFGGDYYAAETFDDATRYLKKRYFVERSRLYQREVIFRDLPRDNRLNKLLASNWTYATNYIRDVLVKEILIQILADHHSIDLKTANDLCVKTEVSFINEKRNKLRQQRGEQR